MKTTGGGVPQQLETAWHCSRCQAAETVEYPARATCDAVWLYIVERHAQLSPECDSIKVPGRYLALSPCAPSAT
jgi:hypothetical protein